MCERYSLDQLRDYIKNDISDELRKELKEHIISCETCRKELEELTLLQTLLIEIKEKEVVTENPDLIPNVLGKIDSFKQETAKTFFGYIYKPAFALAFSLFALLFYNSYIMDTYISSLNITLNNINAVESVSEMKMTEPAVRFILSDQIARDKKDSLSIMTLEFVNKVMQESSEDAQLNDVKFLLNSEIMRKKAERGSLLNTMDKAVYFVVNKFVKPASLYAAAEKTKNNELIDGLISNVQKFGREKELLIKKANDMNNDEEKAREYYKIGVAAMKYFDYQTAVDLFGKCLSAKTIDVPAVKFNIAWCKKQLGKYEEARAEFNALDNKELCKYQQADIFDREGKYAKAALMYDELSKETANKEISGLSKFKEGYTYLYGMNDTAKAKEIFSGMNSGKENKLSAYAGDLVSFIDTSNTFPGGNIYSLVNFNKGQTVAYGAEGKEVSDWEATLTKEYAVKGKAYSSKVVLKKGGSGVPLLTRSGKLLKGRRGDWKEYDNLIIKYVLEGNKTCTKSIIIADEEAYGKNWENWRYGNYYQKQVTLQPGENILNIDLSLLVGSNGRAMDLANMRTISLYGLNEIEYTIYIQDVYLEKNNSVGKRRE